MIIGVLAEEKSRLDEVIQNLELSGTLAGEMSLGSKRRGRKSMPESERRIVSDRMRKYWEEKRKN